MVFMFQRLFRPASTSVHIYPFFFCVSEHTDQTFPLLNFLLNFIAGGGNFSLRGQDSTQEASQHPSYGGIKGPAQRAEGRPEGQRFGPTIIVHFLRTPAGRVQHEAHHQQQAWRKENTMRQEVWSRTCKQLEQENKQCSWNRVTQHWWKKHLFDKHLICEEMNAPPSDLLFSATY